MNGATAEPCVKTIKMLNSSRTIMIGSKRNFFRSFINDHSSEMSSPISLPLPFSSIRIDVSYVNQAFPSASLGKSPSLYRNYG